MKTTENINEIAKAMAAAQNDMKPAAKDAINPHFKSKYSNISSVWEAIRAPLTSNGITVWQDITTSDKHVSVVTRLVHTSGQWVEFGPLDIPVGRQDAQGIGSATSYAKRYALCAAIGVVSDDDDDGEAAVGRGNFQHTPKTQAPTMTPGEKRVSAEQLGELNNLLMKCDDNYKANFNNNLRDHFKVDSMEKLPANRYNDILISMTRNVNFNSSQVKIDEAA